MVRRTVLCAIVSAAVCVPALLGVVSASQPSAQPVPVDADDLGGVVTGAKGPEAGVWVIAETADLPTKFAKIVVTDDQGRYLLPDLPKATYSVWVRGYGLVDSRKTRGRAGPHAESDRGHRAQRAGGGGILPGRATGSR